MNKVKAGWTAAALLAAFAVSPVLAQSAGTSAGTGATGGVSTGTGGSVSTGTGGSVGSGTTASPSAASTPNANDPGAAAGLRSASSVDANATAMPVATISGGAVVPATATMGAAPAGVVVTPGVTYTHYYVNVPANVSSRGDFQRWQRLK